MELWDAYTRDEIPTGKTLVRGEPIPDGLYHLVCEVLVRHIDGSYLCMKRALSKEAFPGYYEATAGGSALLGETPLLCIKRELREETGLVCESFTELWKNVFDEDHAIFHSFLCTVSCGKDDIRLQEGETEGYRWLAEAEFIDFVNSDSMIPTQKKRFYEHFRSMGYIR